MTCCTNCGEPCDTARVNCGPMTPDDVAQGRDRFTESRYSACCEAEVWRGF